MKKTRLETWNDVKALVNNLTPEQLGCGIAINIADEDDEEGEFYGNNIDPNALPQVYLVMHLFVHTQNLVGKDNIKMALRNAKRAWMEQQNGRI